MDEIYCLHTVPVLEKRRKGSSNGRHPLLTQGFHSSHPGKEGRSCRSSKKKIQKLWCGKFHICTPSAPPIEKKCTFAANEGPIANKCLLLRSKISCHRVNHLQLPLERELQTQQTINFNREMGCVVFLPTLTYQAPQSKPAQFIKLRRRQGIRPHATTEDDAQQVWINIYWKRMMGRDASGWTLLILRRGERCWK